MSGFVRLQLSIMMFLQYAIWGSWGVTMATYLGAAHKFQGVEIGWVYNTMQIGAILSPLFIGIIADRLFATQTVLSICHLTGAGILWAAATADTPRNVFLLMLAYGMLFMPTLALTNSISFRNMNDPDREFPGVRVLGTIGWIVAGLVVGGTSLTADGQIGFDLGSFHIGAKDGQPIANTNNILYLASALSAALGVFCVTLPHTPPVKSAGGKQPGAFAALAMLKEPSFAILMLISFGISVVLAFYYQLTNPFLNDLKLENSAQWQTLGQWSEIIFMLALPFIVTTLGVKWTLLLGMVAWCVRYGIFYTQDLTWIKFLGLPLHGICYDFFFVVSQLYVDQRAPRELRASAQGLLTLITLGLGMFVGNILAGYAKDLQQTPPIEGLSLAKSFLPTFLWEPSVASTVASTTSWPGVWLPAAIGCGVATALFLVGFRDSKNRVT
jgi:nucleoside transporter